MHDFKVSEPLDIWDSFNPRDRWRSSPSGLTLALFGNQNVGDASRCNAQIGGQTFGDQRLVVQSLRARTNIDVDSLSAVAADAWRGWAHSTVCDLVVGGRPALSAPLSALLSAPHPVDTRLPADARPIGSIIDQLQAIMLRDMSNSGDHDIKSLAGAAALTAWRLFAEVPSVLIPERQCYHVRVKSEPRTLGALLEVLPTTAVPESLVWIHLHGSNIHGGA